MGEERATVEPFYLRGSTVTQWACEPLVKICPTNLQMLGTIVFKSF